MCSYLAMLFFISLNCALSEHSTSIVHISCNTSQKMQLQEVVIKACSAGKDWDSMSCFGSSSPVLGTVFPQSVGCFCL